MRKLKIAVALPPALVSRMRQAVRRGDAASVSDYVSRAVEERSTRDNLGHMLDAMLAETGGPLTRAAQRTADEALGIKSRRRTLS